MAKDEVEAAGDTMTTDDTVDTVTTVNIPDEPIDMANSGEEVPAKEETPTAEEPALSPETLQLASEYGFSADDLDGFDDAKAMKLFGGRDRWLIEKAQTQAAPVQPAPGQEATAEEVKEWQLLKLEGVGLDGLKMDELDEGLQGALKGNSAAFGQVQEYVNTLAQAADAQLRQLQQAVMGIQEQMAISRFDGFVGGLGEEYHEFLGKGESDDLAATSPKLAEARAKIFTDARVLQNMYKQQYNKDVPLRQAWEMALRAAYPDVAVKKEVGKIKGSLKKRQAALSDKPARTPGKPPISAREKAIRAMQGA